MADSFIKKHFIGFMITAAAGVVVGIFCGVFWFLVEISNTQSALVEKQNGFSDSLKENKRTIETRSDDLAKEMKELVSKVHDIDRNTATAGEIISYIREDVDRLKIDVDSLKTGIMVELAAKVDGINKKVDVNKEAIHGFEKNLGNWVAESMK